MKLRKCFRMALNMVLHSRLRSWLTILGIIIGVASVISIVGIGQGLNQQITSNLGTLNADIITITPGHSKGVSFRGGRDFGGGQSLSTAVLSDKDIQALKTVNQISLINPMISGSVKVSYLGKQANVQLTGVDQKVYSQISTTTIYKGRNLGPSDFNVVLIGKNLAQGGYFDKNVNVNQMITIGGNSFRVVGILNDSSDSIIMPIKSAYNVLTTKTKGDYNEIQLKVKNANLLNTTTNQITTALMRSRHVTAKTQDFSIRTNQQSNSIRQTMISTLTTFLTAIASVSLIVGAVGIANTMFTAVLEKTKDIGIMKSIGARNFDILVIFLFNAALIGFVGGMLGIFIGFLFSKILTMVGLTSIVTLNSVLITLFIAIIVGMLSGFIPAINASKLDPVEALRRE